jgi:AraC-like DNA-binding protein
VCYLVLPVVMQPAIPGLLRQLARTGALAVPLAFWLAARLYFDDAFQPRTVHGAFLLGLLGVRALVAPWPLAVSAIAIAVVFDAFRHILAGTSSDLLLSRLRLRYAILLGTGLYVLLVLIAEGTVTRGSRVDGFLSAANDIGLFLLVGTISMMILRVEPDLVRASAKRQLAVEPPTILDKRLERLIEEEHVYMTVGLTIGDLAERLGEHEYKVRQLINARLGFRNFGSFLNHYRVRDALKVLADPGQKQLGVAEIAYRFGYSSLGPFNRAFKEIVGQTPTEYRKAALEHVILADSGNGKASSKGS